MVLIAVGIMATAIPVVRALTNDAPPPAEDLAFTAVRLPERGIIEVQIQNGGTEDLTVAQVLVDGAFRDFTIDSSASIGRLGSRTIVIPYPWITGESHSVRLLTSTGATFDTTIDVATISPVSDGTDLIWLALIGFYIGIVAIGLGLLSFQRIGRAGSGAIAVLLGVSVGLVGFLAVEAYLGALDVAHSVPTALNGSLLVPVGFVVSLLMLAALGTSASEARPVSTRLAAGIGLHNAGEGLAVGSALATGRTALGVSLIIGFTLHNVLEGVAIANVAVTDAATAKKVALLGLIAGAPAIPGAILGGAVISSTYHALFLSVGAAALAFVLIELLTSLRRTSTSSDRRFVIGIAGGVVFMYATGLLISI